VVSGLRPYPPSGPQGSSTANREVNPAWNFYERAIRFDELFEPLVLPLKANRHANVEADFTEETTSVYRRQRYSFDDIDVILLEIYLLKRQFQHLYDLSIWIDCTFETALERAIKRGQEGLPPDDVIQAYRTIYFPAQHIHSQRTILSERLLSSFATIRAFEERN
jgi:uridine kinase